MCACVNACDCVVTQPSNITRLTHLVHAPKLQNSLVISETGAAPFTHHNKGCRVTVPFTRNRALQDTE